MIEIIPNWHPLFVHFTVALFAMGWLFYFLVLFAGRRDSLTQQWRAAARWNLWSGMLLTVFTLVAGLDAYNTVDHDTESHLAMTDHRNWALVTAGLFAMVSAWSVWLARRGQSEGIVFFLVLTLATGLLASTAWRGGELVYRHGLGVMSLPDLGAHDHAAHVHGAEGEIDHDGSHAEMHDEAAQMPVDAELEARPAAENTMPALDHADVHGHHDLAH